MSRFYDDVRLSMQAFQAYISAWLDFSPRPPDINRFLEVSKHLFVKDATLSLSSSSSSSPQATSSPTLTPSLEQFQLLKVLGKGAFGKVYLVRHKETSALFAMKVLNKMEVRRRNQEEHTKMERAVLGAVTHPFVVTLRFAFQSADKLFMVTDYCPGP